MQLNTIIEECGEYLPFQERDEFIRSLRSSPVVAIRRHPKKFHDVLWENTPVLWCNNGLQLKERPVFTLDPAFHSGEYYVQEPSSMIIGEIIRELILPMENPCIYDAAAAPGGKTTHILEVLDGKGCVVANEPDTKRFSKLVYNIRKSGYDNVLLTSTNHPDPGLSVPWFDIIVLDAPCSGSGLFRKDPEWMKEWKPHWVERFVYLQKKIFLTILPLLRPGGFFIYSTCSFSASENEEQTSFFLSHGMEEVKTIALERAQKHGVLRTRNGYRFYPHRVPGEGFFVSVFRKNEQVLCKNTETRSKKFQMNFIKDIVTECYSSYEDDVVLKEKTKEGEKFIRISSAAFGQMKKMKECGWDIRKKGMTIGIRNAYGKWVPSQDLAMSVDVRQPEEFEYFYKEVDGDTVIKILKNGQSRKIDFLPHEKEGFYLLTYRNNGFIWIKKDNRNRLRFFLPEEHRIKKSSW